MRAADTLAIVVSTLVVATTTSVVRALPPDPRATEAAVGGTPGAKALLAGEEPALGASIPDLGDGATGEVAPRPIRRVEVVTAGGRWASSPSLTSVKPGDLATRAAARRLLREVLANGHFARANVEAFDEAGGVVLHLNVLPRRIVASVQLKGGTLDTAETLEAADVGPGAEVTAPRLGEIAARIRRHYEQHGFPSTDVRVDTADTDEPSRVILTVEVKPGAPRLVARRVFVIDPAIDREVGDLKTGYKVGRGARADERGLAEADRELTETLRQHGFLRAEVRHRLLTNAREREPGKASVDPAATNTFLYVYVLAGPRFVPVFEGNLAFDRYDLEDALNLVKQPDARPVELAERLHQFYVLRGFLDAEVTGVEAGKPAEAVHYLSFKVHEHDQVRVIRRVFPCLAAALTPDEVGREIGSFLEEDLPGAETFGPVDPRAIDRLFGPHGRTGGRGRPTDLNPSLTFAPDTYDRAVKHIRDLLHSKGYLNAVVGPVSVVRATCARHPRGLADQASPGALRTRDGICVPVLPKEPLTPVCAKDSLGLPLPEPAVPQGFQCHPDPARGVECAPEMTVRIPVAVGPETTLYDLAFEGNKTQTSAELARVANLPLGTPLSSVELEAARLRVLDAYRGRGFAYADVRAEPEPSPDRTRARVRFYVTEREAVIVKDFVVKGATRTSEALILSRLALKKDKEYRLEWARQSEARVATLGTFSSVSVSLEDPEVPERQKRVVITVVEQASQYIEQRPGFSTGDGFRYTFEYGHRNLGGQAIAMTLRVQLSYLPDAFILDPTVLANYSKLPVQERLERRDTLSFTLREIGLGPLVSLTLEAIDLNDNERDYGINKEAFVPTITYRPIRQLTTQLSGSVEYNNVNIFNAANEASTFGLIRAPQGETMAAAGRIGFTADYRDNPFNATKGALFATSLEYVNAYPIDQASLIATCRESSPAALCGNPSHLIRLTGKVSAYATRGGVTLAASFGLGGNIQLTSTSATYPDRLFFLGGVDTHRAFLADALVPQDIADKIKSVGSPPGRDASSGLPTGQRNPAPQPGLPTAQRALTIDDVALRGGDLMINPRVELRIPIASWLAGGIFLDAGNVWQNPTNIRLDADFLRYGLGPGLRVPTPIGPIAFDYGFNLNRRSWEDVGAFHFSIGLF